MACLKPLKAIGVLQSNNKYKITIIKNLDINDKYNNAVETSHYKKFLLPCGKCEPCRLEYSKQWAARLCEEAKLWQNNVFLTLTYNDEAIPLGSNPKTPDEISSYTLNPKDVQDFFKRLRTTYKRKYNHSDIRYYACGEYGGQTFRPHYHAIVYNLPIPDKTYYKSNFRGDIIYTSQTLEKIWKKGFVTIGQFSYDTAAYTARYMQKKVNSSDDIEAYQSVGMIPEFSRMSLKPALGRRPENINDIYLTDKITIMKGEKVFTCKPPKYYDKLFEKMHPEQLILIRDERRISAINAHRKTLEQTDLTENDYNTMLEEQLHRKIKSLKREI